jgi:hypothetical protein
MCVVSCRHLARNSTTAIAREQLYGHVISLATRERTIMEETFSVQSVPRAV